MKITSSRKRRRPTLLPFDLADLAMASWETIARRSWMMLSGECSATEYQKMLHEKLEAVRDSAFAAALNPGQHMVSAALAPWTQRARANAKRLRKIA